MKLIIGSPISNNSCVDNEAGEKAGKNYLLMEAEPTLLVYLQADLSDTSFRDRQDYYTHTHVTGYTLSEPEQAATRGIVDGRN